MADPLSPESIKQILLVQGELNKANEKSSELFKEQKSTLEDLTESFKIYKDLAISLGEQSKLAVETQKQELKLAEERLQNAASEEEKVALEYEVMKQKVILKEKELEQYKVEVAQKEAIGQLTEEEKKAAQERLKQKEKELADDKKHADLFRQIHKEAIVNSNNELAIREKNNNAIREGLKDAGKQMLIASGLGDIVRDMSADISLSNAIFNKLLTSAAEIFSTVMNANSEFAKTTGQMADRSIDFGAGASQFGIGFEKMHQAQMQLYTSMSGFSSQSRGVQESLTMTAAKMELLGVSATTTGQNLDVLTRAFGMNAERAGKVQEEIARHAMAAGIPPKQMAEDFGKYASQMSVYGERGIDVFVRMEKASKSLGVSMDTLNSLVGESMDTFQGSATAAGKLNAVLGGNYLNSLELLNANEADRIVMIKRSIEASGVQFSQMDKFQQKAIANALGIKNISDANNLLSKSSAQLSLDMNKQAVDQKKLEEVQREAANVQDQVKVAFQQLLIAIRPIVEIIKAVITGIAWFMDLGNGWVGRILAFVLVISKLVGALRALDMAAQLGAVKKYLLSIVDNIGFAVGWVAGGVKKMIASFRDLDFQAGLSKAKLAFGAVAEKIGFAFGWIQGGVQKVIGSFRALDVQAIITKANMVFGNIAEAAGKAFGFMAGGLKSLTGSFKGLDIQAGLTKARLFFTNIASSLAGSMGTMAGGVSGLTRAFGLNKAAAAVSAFFTKIFGSTVAAAGAETATGGAALQAGSVAASTGMETVAAAASVSWQVILAFGAAIALVGAGIWLAATGLSTLVQSFSGLGDAAMPAAIAVGVFTVAFVVLMIALAAMVTGPQAVVAAGAVGLLLSIGAAALMIGLGIGIAAAGIAYLIKAIGDLAKGMSAEAATNLALIAGSIMLLTISIGALMLTMLIGGPLGLLALAGFFIGLGAAVYLFTKAISKDDVEKLNAFGNAVGGLAAALQLTGVRNSAKEIAASIATITEEIEKIPENKVTAFTTTMDSFANSLAQVKTVEVEKINSAKEFVTTAKEYYEAQSQSKDSKDDALVSALSKILGGGAEGGKEGAAGGAAVILQVDGTKLAKILLPHIKSGKVDPTIIQGGV